MTSTRAAGGRPKTRNTVERSRGRSRAKRRKSSPDIPVRAKCGRSSRKTKSHTKALRHEEGVRASVAYPGLAKGASSSRGRFSKKSFNQIVNERAALDCWPGV